jgi:O-antigen ligase
MVVASDERADVRPVDVVIRWISIIGLFVTSLLVLANTDDSFRLPKELAARSEAILLIVIVAVARIWNMRMQWTKLCWRDTAVFLPAAILIWTALTTLTSTNRMMSARTLAWVATAVITFIAIYATGRDRQLTALHALVGAAIANSILAILQESKIWNPIPAREQGLAPHLYTSGFIGNPDDLGGFLVVAALVAMALVVVRKEGRVVMVICLGLIAGGLAAAQSMAAFLATAVGLLMMSWMHSRRVFAAAIVIIIAAGVFASLALVSVRSKLEQFPMLVQDLRHGEPVLALEGLSSNRVVPAMAALHMFREHPIAGVGPGNYGPQYFFAAMCVENKYPPLRQSGTSYFHFGEAHNDHLQALAVAGLPGYALFLAAPIALAIRTRRARRDDDERRRLAWWCGPPLAAAFLVLTIFQFPLELAAVTMALVYVGALLMRWSRDDAD